MKEIRFGIAGLGGIAHRFAKVLTSSEVEGVKLAAAAASSDAEKAKNFAEQYGADKWYGSYAELAQDENIDVVYIATTHNFHYENAMTFLRAGKAVICEKPFFLTEKEALAAAELAQAKNLFIMEAMWTRCLPSFQKAREWALSGRIGQIKLIDASFCFSVPFDEKNRLYNPFTAGGALYDGGVYPIEYVTGILGEKPAKIKALSLKAGTGVDEVTTVNFEFASGTLAQTRCAVGCRTRNDAIIYGARGHIVTHDFLMAKETTLFDEDGNAAETFSSEFSDGFCFEINHAAELLRQGKTRSPLIPLEDTIACAAIFDEVMSQL